MPLRLPFVQSEPRERTRAEERPEVRRLPTATPDPAARVEQLLARLEQSLENRFTRSPRAAQQPRVPQSMVPPRSRRGEAAAHEARPPALSPSPSPRLPEGCPQPYSDIELAALGEISYRREPPEYFTCPVTLSLLEQPVTLPSGHTIELRSITRMADEKGDFNCPLTRRPRNLSQVYYSINLRDAITAWKAENKRG